MNALRITSIVGGVMFFILFMVTISTSGDFVVEEDNTRFQLSESLSEQCVLFNEDLSQCLQYGQLSVIDVDYKLAESDEGSIDKLSAGDIFGIETVAVKYDKAFNKQSSSDVISLPTVQSLIGGDAFLIDNIQVAFFGVTNEPALSLNLEGTVNFYLDNQLIPDGTKRIWFSGSIKDSTPLFIVDSIPTSGSPAFDKRKETFDFTFTDEGWKNGEKHIFRVVISEVSGTLANNEFIKKIQWNGEHIAYTLEMEVNESTIVEVNELGQAVQILKSDSKVVVCGTTGQLVKKSINSYIGRTMNFLFYNYANNAVPPTVSVYDSQGNLIGTEVNILPEGKNPDYSKVELVCKTIDGLQRDADYTIKVGTKEFPVHTPLTQQNYNLECHKEGGTINLIPRCDPKNCNNTLSGWDAKNTGFWEVCTSNFGYNETGVVEAVN